MQVDKIVDVTELCEIISAVGLTTDGLDTKEEMKKKLREHLEESPKSQQVAKVSSFLISFLPTNTCSTDSNIPFRRLASQIYAEYLSVPCAANLGFIAYSTSAATVTGIT